MVILGHTIYKYGALRFFTLTNTTLSIQIYVDGYLYEGSKSAIIVASSNKLSIKDYCTNPPLSVGNSHVMYEGNLLLLFWYIRLI